MMLNTRHCWTHSVPYFCQFWLIVLSYKICLSFSGAEYDTKLGGSAGLTVKKLLEELYEKVI